MNKLISILFGLVASVIHVLRGSAVTALATHPCVAKRTIENVTTFGVKTSDTVIAVGVLGTIDGTARKMGCQFRDGDAEHLLAQDVVNALATVRHLRLKSSVKPLDNLTEKHARLRHGVEKGGGGRREQLLRQYVQHLVRQRGRREHLIVAQIGEAVEHIGIVRVSFHRLVG